MGGIHSARRGSRARGGEGSFDEGGSMRALLRRRMLAVVTACIASLVLVATASAGGHRYIVGLKDGKTKAGLAAVARAGGKVVQITPQIGVATAVSRGRLGLKPRATGLTAGVPLQAARKQPALEAHA